MARLRDGCRLPRVRAPLVSRTALAMELRLPARFADRSGVAAARYVSRYLFLTNVLRLHRVLQLSLLADRSGTATSKM